MCTVSVGRCAFVEFICCYEGGKGMHPHKYLICREANVCELLLRRSDPLGDLEIRASELKENASLVYSSMDE